MKGQGFSWFSNEFSSYELAKLSTTSISTGLIYLEQFHEKCIFFSGEGLDG